MSLVERAGAFAGALALHAFHERELEHLGALISARSPAPMRIASDEAWLAASLPARGRILVGHCGDGATLAWLLARGFDVEAFDPSHSLVARARVRVGSRARVDVLDVAGFIDDAPRRAPFDAVLLEGFDRCLTATTRASLLRACASACPRGPILLRAARARAATSSRARREDAERTAARIGRALGALRGLSSAGREELALLDGVGPACSVDAASCRGFGGAELSEVAARLGCRVVAHGTRAALVRLRSVPELDHVATDLLADVMSARGRHRLVARGSSMTPAIPSGALVELVALGGSGASPGDVVAARVHGHLLVHRVVGTDAAGRVLMKGDACASPDGWVERRDVLGRVASFDDGAGPRPVPPATPAVARWRRGLARVERAMRALA